MSTRKMTATITLFLETDDGKTPTDYDMRLAMDYTKEAIRNRLFGEGFLDSNMLVEEYNIKCNL